MNFRGCRKKLGPKIGHDPAARPLAGAEVLVAVGGLSPPSVGGREKEDARCEPRGGHSVLPLPFARLPALALAFALRVLAALLFLHASIRSNGPEDE